MRTEREAIQIAERAAFDRYNHPFEFTTARREVDSWWVSGHRRGAERVYGSYILVKVFDDGRIEIIRGL